MLIDLSEIGGGEDGESRIITTLGRRTVPDRTIYHPELDVYMHTGAKAVEMGQRFRMGHLATDIETPGLDNNFTINCVTMCWEDGGQTHTILLDPMRDEGHRRLCQDMYARAHAIVLHNAPFDVPALVHRECMRIGDINKIVDTVVLARYGFPTPPQYGGHPKTLGALAGRFLGMEDNAKGMERAFKAAGFKTIQAGYEGMDIDSPIYRQGAMLDTVATLRLQPILRKHCLAYSQEHPYEVLGATNFAEAEAIIEKQEMVHRVMLRRTARGIAVDRDYLYQYAESVHVARVQAEAELASVGLEGGAGKAAKLIEHLDRTGELPAAWPRTPKGKLRATKDDLEALEHPLAKAQRFLAETDKVMGYIRKVDRQAAVTGHCHPQCGTLAASATGRMAYSQPELQQFNKDARPVLMREQGLTSIDWSQIEPITMGILAQDEDFLAPYEAGLDLYEPLMRAAGIDRPRAKIVLLADMYGQGEASMAARIGASPEQAGQIRRQMRSAMKRCTRWMAKAQTLAATYGCVVTAGGRILPVDKGGVFRAVNYIVQGSAYDVLAHTICEMEREGMGDEIYLAMHDEVIVSTEVGEAVQQIMMTPPPFFGYYLGRDPILRTDRADMGAKWLKV